MFDIGVPELIALIVLAIFVFGPEKLPKLIQDVAGLVRKVRAFSDNAKEDIRSELGPEFKDFEFEDLNPKNFARKHLLDNDDLGIKEIRNGFDLRKDLAEVTDAVNSRDDDSGTVPVSASPNGSTASAAEEPGSVRLDKDGGKPGTAADDAPPYDADAT
ncbi:sec-independent translocase [Streptomyces sp. DSM 42041]|uniref:Sec-independent protein translocase protein TatB n=1 Tax=Streptomyces hazeniae TaxID=3075538 RepID=A0ABU2NLY6_9ACTN|nr:sec-independent translocase [Streptomyces sp. DSM 42041]MDT0377997.1 sec-independent translocase [Streptomyces sp. DSM 42041]